MFSCEYSCLPLSCDEHDVRLDVAVGEEYLLLPLLGDADGSHSQVGLTRLHGRNLCSEVHHEELQFPIPAVGPFRQDGRLQARHLARVDEVERWHGRIGGHAQSAPCAALHGYGHGRGIFRLLPAVVYLLVGTVAPYFSQKVVEVLLKGGVALLEDGSHGNVLQSSTHGVHLVGNLSVEIQRQALAARCVHLAALQCCQQVGGSCHALDVGIGSHIGDCNVLDAADDNCHASALQGFEDGGNLRIGEGLPWLL